MHGLCERISIFMLYSFSRSNGETFWRCLRCLVEPRGSGLPSNTPTAFAPQPPSRLSGTLPLRPPTLTFTLCHFTASDCYPSLSFQFWCGKTSIIRIIPQLCHTIVQRYRMGLSSFPTVIMTRNDLLLNFRIVGKFCMRLAL